MGKQYQHENSQEEAVELIREQVKDLKGEGYDAEEISVFLEEQGYDREEYEPVMESEGLEFTDEDMERSEIDSGLEDNYDPFEDAGGYNDDSYGEGGDW